MRNIQRFIFKNSESYYYRQFQARTILKSMSNETTDPQKKLVCSFLNIHIRVLIYSAFLMMPPFSIRAILLTAEIKIPQQPILNPSSICSV